MRAVLDTNIFIAHESGRRLAGFPHDVTELAASIITPRSTRTTHNRVEVRSRLNPSPKRSIRRGT